MKITIVIVNYNVKHYVEQCLLSVERALNGISGEVYVVDNKSTDGSVEYLRGRFPWVFFIQNDFNAGFSKANNQALRMARGEYLMLLNPDTIVGENVLRQCIEFMDSHDDCGGLGLRMLRQDGSFAPESRRGVPTPWTSFCKMVGLCSLFPQSRIFGRYYMQYLPLDEASPIEIISGACMLMRKTTTDICGLLDETFFMYGEDIDLSYRILQAGFKNYYIPSTILHYKGESTQKSSFRYVNAFYQSMLIFFHKHFGKYNYPLIAVVTIAVYAKAALTFLTQQLKKRSTVRQSSMQYIRHKKFLLVGKGHNLMEMEALMEENHLYHSVCKNTLAKDEPTADYVVFDTDAYSFEEILEWFHHNEEMRPRPLIATYISMSRTIITGNVVIQ
ncbi:MAG: glycosyltransferase family 2 protein [Bacteroidaceae bacterium]|nr:glycosyltransferase family 2 protein [Bacteroidaceae bacterium]